MKLLPMRLKWRIEKLGPRCPGPPEDGIVCICSDYDVCLGRFAIPLADAMVQRLNLT